MGGPAVAMGAGRPPPGIRGAAGALGEEAEGGPPQESVGEEPVEVGAHDVPPGERRGHLPPRALRQRTPEAVPPRLPHPAPRPPPGSPGGAAPPPSPPPAPPYRRPGARPTPHHPGPRGPV